MRRLTSKNGKDWPVKMERSYSKHGKSESKQGRSDSKTRQVWLEKRRFCWHLTTIVHYLYSQSLLFIIEAWKKAIYNILTFTLHSYSPWHVDFASYFHFNQLLTLIRRLCFWFVLNLYLSERVHKYGGCDVNQTKFWEFIYEETLAYDFYNFMCIIVCT